MENYNNMNAAMDDNREIGWGEEVLGEEQQFVLLPEGEYDFIVDNVNYVRKNVDNTTCGFSEIVCRIKSQDGDVIVKSSIKLVQKMMWKNYRILCVCRYGKSWPKIQNGLASHSWTYRTFKNF